MRGRAYRYDYAFQFHMVLHQSSFRAGADRRRYRLDYAPMKLIRTTEQLKKCAEASARYRKKYPEKIRASNKKDKTKNRAKYARQEKEWRAKNPEIVKARNDADKKLNKEKHKIVRAKYGAANPDKINALTAKRRAARLNATPRWFEKSAIDWLYLDSSTSPEYSAVDHDIPLNNDIVCGLHCFDNLQVLTFSENSKKSNNFDQDMQSARQLTFTRQKLAAL